MIVMATLSLAGIGVLWALTRAPLWQAVSLSIDYGIESAARDARPRP